MKSSLKISPTLHYLMKIWRFCPNDPLPWCFCVIVYTTAQTSLSRCPIYVDDCVRPTSFNHRVSRLTWFIVVLFFGNGGRCYIDILFGFASARRDSRTFFIIRTAFRRVWTGLPRVYWPHTLKSIFSGSSGNISCVVVHRYAHKRASINSGEWKRNEVTATAPRPRIFWQWNCATFRHEVAIAVTLMRVVDSGAGL